MFTDSIAVALVSTEDTLVSIEVTLASNEVSADPLVVISAPNAVSNESTEELIEESTVLIAVTTASNESTEAPTALTALALATSSAEILVVNEVSAVPLVVISPDSAVSNESTEFTNFFGFAPNYTSGILNISNTTNPAGQDLGSHSEFYDSSHKARHINLNIINSFAANLFRVVS